MTRGELVAELAAVVGAPHEARFIVDESLGLGLALGHPSPPTGALDEPVVAAARALAARRAAGEPLQYVFGHWPFRTLDLAVDPRVLIPRPETEQVVEVALAEARRLRDAHGAPLVAVDAGTGSGAIALSLAAELGPAVLAEIWATDASDAALTVAAANTARLGAAAQSPWPSVELVQGSWLTPLPARLQGRVALVVANPPYVSEAEWDALADEVRAEPRQALVAGPAGDGTPGLADVEAVLDEARAWLGRPGAVVIELAPHQAEAARQRAAHLGYDDVEVRPDLARRARVLVARR